MTPREPLPKIIHAAMLMAANTHFVILSQAIPFRSTGLPIVWPQHLALATIDAALFWFALQRCRRFLR